MIQSRALNLALFATGLLLLAAGVTVVGRSGEDLVKGWASVREGPWWVVGLIAILPLVNWALTSTNFWLLTRRFGKVGPGEMSALIGSAWLLNMLPMKPGLFGRLAYHKAISNIPVRTSLWVVVLVLATGGVGIVLTIAAVLVIDSPLRASVPMDRLLPIVGLVLVGGIVPMAAVRVKARWNSASRTLRDSTSDARDAFEGRWAVHRAGSALWAGVGLRMIETLVWAARYKLAFAVTGDERTWGICVLVAGVSQIAGQMPIQVGLREWAVGVSAAVLSGASMNDGSAGASAIAVGLKADLLNRGAEILCAIPVGLLSFAWIARRIKEKR